MRRAFSFSRPSWFRIGLLAAFVFLPPQIGLSQVPDIDALSDEEAKQVQIAERFLTVLEKSPRRGTALERVYGHHVEFGTLDQFIQGLHQRVETNPNDGTGWMLLGLFESQRGQDADAVDAYVEAEKYLADDAMPAYYMGQSLILIGQPEKAVEAFERAISREPRRADMLEIFRQLGRVHQRGQRTEEALSVWQRLEALFPDDPRVQEQIAVTLVEEGEYELALPRYERLAQLVKDDYRKVVFKIEAAELKIRENKRTEGLDDFEKLLSELNPTGWLFRDVRRRIEEVFLRAGDQDGLVKYYEDWLAKNPEDINGMTRLAKFLAASARVPEATEWMEKALKLAPSRTELRKAFIDQLVNDQRYDEATKQYAELVKSAPGNPDFLRDWGRLVLKNKELEEDKRKQDAVKIWNRIVAARPDDALTNAQVADLLRQANIHEQAIALYKKAIELAPNEPQYREYLGEYYHTLKRPEEALATWVAIAEGSRHNAVNVARLAEVYNSFGYLPQAVENIAEACKLEPKEFTLQVRASEYHMRAGKYDEALDFIDVATALASNDEQQDAALRGRIEVLQSSKKLDEEIERLQGETKNGTQATFEQWHTLARYLEADRRWADATEAVESALAKTPKSVLALTTAARIAELSGAYSEAADVNRKLAEVDRRSRSEHLMNVSRLEAQLGRSEEALAAGRELIVSAPGNTDNYEFYAQLCFQLGKNEDGLDVLRKAVRINPTEPHLTMALGSALSREFRIDEAIEVYWRAFEKTEEIEDKTSLTEKLTQLYQQLNQFDKLIERFERDRREEAKRREMTICLAQAHHTSGDYGSARQELESLLSSETRDTNLLQQLSKLCESGSDIDAAVAYQRQLVSIAPGHETEFRLAKLLEDRGDREEASEILVRLTRREENPYRLLRSLDSLLRQTNYESVIAITEPLLSETRDDWELLYREAVAWASMEKIPEARIRFERLLALNHPYDELGVGAQEKLKRDQAKARSDNLRGIQSRMPKRQSPLSLLSRASQVQQATGLGNQDFGRRGPQAVWTPDVYGVARMAAFGWLMRFENEDQLTSTNATEVTAKANDTENDVKLADRIAEQGASPDADRESIYDWLYVEQLMSDYKTVYDIAKRLATEGGKEEQQFFLRSLATRSVNASSVNSLGSSQQPPKQNPLPDDEIDLMLQCYEAIQKADEDAEQQALASGGQIAYSSNGQMYINVGGSWVAFGTGSTGGLGLIVKELELAGRESKAEELLNARIASAKSATELAGVINTVLGQEKYDELPELYEKWTTAAKEEIALAPNKLSTGRSSRSTNVHRVGQLQTISQSLVNWTAKLAADEENAQVLEIMDKAFDLAVTEGKKRRIQQASNKRRRSANPNYYSNYISAKYGKEQINVNLDYPRPNAYVDNSAILALRQSFEVLQRNDVLEDLPSRLRQRVARAEQENGDDLLYEQLMLGYVLWWLEERDEAVELLTAAANQLTDDPTFRFEMAQLHESLGDFDEALAIVDSIAPRDQKLVQQREMKALQLAERLGDIDRARDAAERLFGLRLNTDVQLQLVGQMRRLGLLEMAEAIVSRVQRRSGNQISSMGSLMSLYQGQGKTELAEQIAHRILQRTKSPLISTATSPRGFSSSRGSNDSASRAQALKLLKQTGALKKIVSRLESQLERSPESPRFYEQLIECYEAANERDKVQALLEKAIEVRPDSMMYRYKLAKQYENQGKSSEACDQYLEILQKNPRWISNEFYQIESAFRRAKRSIDLVKAVQKMNLKSFGHPHYVTNLVSNMIGRRGGEDSEENLNLAVQLLERLYEAYPNYRGQLASQFRQPKLWKNDRVYQLGKKGIIPTEQQVDASPWVGVNQIYSYSGDGSVGTTFSQIVEGVKGTANEKDLYQTIEQTVEKLPDWHGGKAMLALIDLSRNKKLEAKSKLKEILADEKVIKSMPSTACWIVGQELDKFDDSRDLALKLFEKAVSSNDQNSMNQIQYSPIVRLIKIYGDSGRKDDARKLILRKVDGASLNQYDQQYSNYQRVENKSWAASQLLDLGFPVDSILLYRELLDDQQALESAVQYRGDSLEPGLKIGLKKSIDSALADDNATKVMEQLLSPREKLKPGSAAVDLLISVPAIGEMRKKSISSQLFELLDSVGENDNSHDAIQQRVQSLREAQPADISIAIVDAYVDLKHDPDAATKTIASLAKIVEENPLDEIPEGRRPNARQRRQAMLLVPLWLVAKECLASEDHQETGQKLAEVALVGARRQISNVHLVSILYDWGKVALNAGNREQAEQKWAELLEQVTKRPIRKKKKSDARPPVTPPLMRRTGRLEIDANTVDRLQGYYVGLVQEPATAPQQSADDPPPPEKSGTVQIPPLTKSQFQIALEIAKAAAENGMPELSLRAVKKSLAGGLPVADLASPTNLNRQVQIFSSGVMSGGRIDSSNINSMERAVASAVREVLREWKDNKAYPPMEVYDLLHPIIMPAARSTDILMFSDSSGIQNGNASSLGVSLVNWAHKAGKLDDLKKRIAVRREHEPSRIPALVLEFHADLIAKDIEGADKTLAELADVVETNSIPLMVNLACHAAIPAYDQDALQKNAVRILRKSLELSNANNRNRSSSSTLGELASMVNRYLAQNGDENAVKEFFENYLLGRQATYSQYSGDYGQYLQWRDLANIAAEAAKTGVISVAMDFMGRVCDTSYQNRSRPSIKQPMLIVSRALRKEPADAQFEKWSTWTLPDEGRRAVRLHAEWVSPGTVPARFSSKKEEQVDVLHQSTSSDFYSNVTELYRAAKDSNNLDKLSELAKHAYEEKLPNAEFLTAILAIKQNDLDAAKPIIQDLVQTMKDRMKRDSDKPRPSLWGDYLVYRSCIEQSPEFGQLYGDGKGLLVQLARDHFDNRTLAHIENDFARSRAAGLGSELSPGSDPGFVHWFPISNVTEAPDGIRSWWVKQQNQIAHISGPSRDMLCFKYPLTGNFQFSFDAFQGSWVESDAGYGGIIVEGQSRRYGTSSNIMSVSGHENFQRGEAPRRNRDEFGRITIQSDNGELKYWLNGYLVYQEKLSGTAPWITLYTEGPRKTAFRNFSINGEPEIPREVLLFAGDRMDGWSTRFFNETQPRHRVMAEKAEPNSSAAYYQQQEPTEFDWRVKDDILNGRAIEGSKPDKQSWTYYQRPLLSGEAFSYDFFYSPNSSIANPSIGRIALLLDSDRVAEQWISSASEKNLIPNSEYALTETMGLKENDWNSVELAIRDGQIQLTLNGTRVYERPANTISDLRFGLFRYKPQRAKVRNAKLRGNWPEELTSEITDDLLASTKTLAVLDQRLIHELIGDRFVLHEFDRVIAQANELPAGEAYAMLKDWVLPNDIHNDFRMYFKFPPRKPETISETPQYGRDRPMICPAAELVRVAAKAEKLDELVDEVNQYSADTQLAKRSKNALLALAAIQSEDDEQALLELAKIYKTMEDGIPETLEEHNRAAEVVVAWHAATRPALQSTANDICKKLLENLNDKTSVIFRRRVESLQGRIASIRVDDSKAPQNLTQWTPIPWESASTNAAGYCLSDWRLAEQGVLEHVAGESRSLLYFRSPLRGDFEIHADVTAKRGRTAWLSYGMHGALANDDLKGVRYCSVFHSSGSDVEELEIPDWSDLAHYRIVVEGSGVKTFVNGVQVYEQILDGPPEPWIMLKPEEAGNRCRIRNLRIAGEPTVLDEINLSEAAGMAGWTAGRFQEKFSSVSNNETAAWRKNGDELHGRIAPSKIAQFRESVLVYQRPMLEDGEFEFESYYEPEKMECHPVMGGSAFLVRPDGIYLHRISNAQWEDVGLRTVTSETKIETSKPVSLKEKDWNEFLIKVMGNQMILTVNGSEVLQYEIDEPHANRHFGFFRYADQTETRVRKIVYRGDWPKQLPSLADQELAYPSTGPFSARSNSGSEIMALDLNRSHEELKRDGFSVLGPADQIKTSKTGLRLELKNSDAYETWPGLSLGKSIEGDFDVTVDFQELKIESFQEGWGIGFDFQAELDDQTDSSVAIGIHANKEGKLFAKALLSHDLPSGKRGYDEVRMDEKTDSGKLRLVRKGKEIHCLFAGADLDFRLIESFIVGEGVVNELRIMSKSSDKNAKLDVTVEEFSLTTFEK